MNLIPDNANIEEMQKQFETLQNLTGEQRLQIAFDLSDKKRQKLIDDIKKEHPEFTKQQLILEIIRRCYGEKLAQEVATAKGWK